LDQQQRTALSLTAIAITLESLTFPCLAQPPAARLMSSSCTPVAQLVSANNLQRSQSLICEEEKLEISSDAMVKVVCFSDQRTRILKGATVNINALCQNAAISNPCVIDSSGHCIRGRGESAIDRPRIISPALPITTNRHPSFAWTLVPKATAYSIQVRGNGGIFWQATTTGTQISYPQEQPELIPGNAYSIVIFAYKNESDDVPIAYIQSSVSILTPAQLTANFPPTQIHPIERDDEIQPATLPGPAAEPRL
jgi:hypothetical protein